MTAPDIDVAELRKTFVVPVREAGLRAAVRGLVRRRHRQVEAVAGASFAIGAGEVVGELAVLDPTATRNATVIASTELRALVLDPRAYRSLRYLPALGRLLTRADRYHAA